jgi:hypothetical protein
MVMEGAWLAATLIVLDAMMAPPTRLAMAAAVALYPFAYIASGLVQRFDRSRRTEILIAAGSFAVGLACFAGAAGAVETSRLWAMGIIGGFAWLRGWTLAGKDVEPSRFAVAFQVGLLVLLAVLALGELLSIDRAILVGLGLTFFLAGLAGIRQARIAGYADRERNAARVRSGGFSMLGILFAAAAGIALWVAIDRALLEMIWSMILWFGGHLQQVVLYLFGLIPDVSLPEFEPEDEPTALPPEQSHRQEKPPESFSPINAYILIGIASVLLIAFGGFILWLAIRYLIGWFHRAQRTPGVVYRRSGPSPRDGLREFWNWLATGFGALGKGLRGLAHRLRWRRLAESSVQDIYRRVLKRLAFSGWWRAPHETPEEYLRRVKASWKGDSSDLEILTAAFVAERFGRIEGDREQARQASLRIRKSLNEMRSARG